MQAASKRLTFLADLWRQEIAKAGSHGSMLRSLSSHHSPPTFLIFGATGGIGSELCRHLAKEHPGARLALAGRSEEKLSELAGEISLSKDLSLGSDSETDRGGFDRWQDVEVCTYTVDMFDADDVERLTKEVASKGGIDGIASCVGNVTLKPAHTTSPKEFEQVVRLNLFTTFNVIRAGVKSMMKNPDGRGGAMAFCSSAVALHGLANHEAIAAAKGGVAALTQSAAATYASKKIRFNAIAPGLTRTPMTARITNSEAALKASRAMHPLGRIGEPYDAAAALAFLLNPKNSFITGQILAVDGGLSCLKAS